jgi:nicotinamide mononucleotide transporter
MVMASATVIATILLASMLRRFTDSNVPWLDATTTSLSLSAQFMQSRKLIENWWVWITADAIYLGLYIYKHLYITTLLYAVFMAMCFAGLMQWRRDLRNPAREHVTA